MWGTFPNVPEKPGTLETCSTMLATRAQARSAKMSTAVLSPPNGIPRIRSSKNSTNTRPEAPSAPQHIHFSIDNPFRVPSCTPTRETAMSTTRRAGPR